MRTEQIQYLLEVNRHASISAAAKSLYLSQTTLSAIVNRMEEELGFPIFSRNYNGVVPTPEGEEALALMEEINACFESIKKLKKTTMPIYQTVTVTISPTIHSALACPLNAVIAAGEPDCSLEFQIVTGEEVGSLLLKNKCNIGLTYFTSASLNSYRSITSKYNIKTENLFADHLYVLVRRDHPFACKDTISNAELKDLDLAMLEHYNSHTASIVYSKNLGSGNRYTTFSSIPLIKQSVLKRNTAAILSGYAIQYDESADLSLMKPLLITGTERPNQIRLCMIYRSAEDLRPQEHAVINYIREYFHSLPHPPFSPEARQKSKKQE